MTNQNKTLKEYLEEKNLKCVKLHLGCGGMKWKDFINVDMFPYKQNVIDSSRDGCVADVYTDIHNLGLDKNTVNEIFTAHTIDHFTRWETFEMLQDWYRILKPEGILIIEVADFVRCVLWLFHPRKVKRKLALNQFYGNQWDRLDYQTHRYLWSARELKDVLLSVGFQDVSFSHSTLTHYPGRDMRMIAKK